MTQEEIITQLETELTTILDLVENNYGKMMMDDCYNCLNKIQRYSKEDSGIKEEIRTRIKIVTAIAYSYYLPIIQFS